MKPLEGKIALVTGAAGTMGLATVKFLLEDGCRVAMVDVNRVANEARARELGGATFPVAFDIADSAAVRAGHARIVERLGAVDILVNNAGILSNNKVEATDDAEWRRVLAANLDGAFYLARAVVPAMKQRRWGRIINTCSLAAKTGGLTAGTTYSVSKGALTSLTFSLARELALHRSHRERHLAGLREHSDGHRAAHRGAAAGTSRAGAGRPFLRAGGVRARRAVPRLTARRVHHR